MEIILSEGEAKKMMYAFNVSLSHIKVEELEQYISKNAIPKKEKILIYMKSEESYCVSSGNVIDVFTNEDTGIIKEGFKDAEYIWNSEMIYYFEKYNLILRNDFIDHVLKKTEAA